MARVVPSDIVTLIEQTGRVKKIFEKLRQYEAENGPIPFQTPPHEIRSQLEFGFQVSEGTVSLLVALVSQLDSLDDLMPVQRDDYLKLVNARETLRSILNRWEHADRDKIVDFNVMDTYGVNPIICIWDVLRRCPDRPIPGGGARLFLFIKNDDYRVELLQDLQEVEKSLADGSWKGATVLAGALIEAILCDQLGELPTADLQVVIDRLKASNARYARLTVTLTDRAWSLAPYIDAAEVAGLISSSAKALCSEAKEFRDLIHPGKAQREQQSATKATAHAAYAALLKLCEELERRLLTTSGP